MKCEPCTLLHNTHVCLACTACLQRAPAEADALKVHLRGWDSLVGCHEYPVALCTLVGGLMQQAVVQKLLEDAALVRELLTRMSWLAILLATAAFTGAITPPGGWDNGRLFLPYAGNINSVDTRCRLHPEPGGCRSGCSGCQPQRWQQQQPS